MNEPTFTDAMLDLRQAVAKQMGSHQAYVQAKVDALVAAHEREMLALRTSLRELVEMHEICDYGCERCKFNENCEEVESDIVKRAKASLGKASGEEANND